MATEYSFRVKWSEDDEGYIVTCPEFPGLSVFAETRAEAISDAEDVLDLFIEQYREDGEPLPDPEEITNHSGQIRLRMPKYLHADLATEADRQGVSMNTLIVSYLQRGVSYDSGHRDAEEMILKTFTRLFSDLNLSLTESGAANSPAPEDYDPLSQQQQKVD